MHMHQQVPGLRMSCGLVQMRALALKGIQVG